MVEVWGLLRCIARRSSLRSVVAGMMLLVEGRFVTRRWRCC